MKLPDQANIIKVAAVVTATPRWVVALLASEGFGLPADWRAWWIVFSVLSAAGMAIVEGVAFAYVFNAWKREQLPRRANVMLILAILSAVLFVVLLSPSIAASVRGAPLATILSTDALLWIWSAVVAASTIAIVASVGYAQRQTAESPSAKRPAVEKVPAVTVEVPEPATEMPADPPEKRRFSSLSAEEILEVANTAPLQIANKFGISRRGAQNWHAQARQQLGLEA